MFFTIDPVSNFSAITYDTSYIPDIIADSAQIYGLEGLHTYGFTIGIVSNLRLGKYFDLRFIPALAFGERELIYTIEKYRRGEKELMEMEKKVYSTFVEFPMHIKYKSKRIHNTRAYVLGGFKYALDLASEAKKNQDELDNKHIKLNRHNLYYEVGVGFDFYTNYFKFGTELKMSYSLDNVVKDEGYLYTDMLDSLKSKMFLLSFTFE
jgi:hypothetical protein